MSKIKKEKNKTVLIIILIILVTILGIICCFLHMFKSYEDDNTNKIKSVKNIDDQSTFEEILIYYGCKNISYSVEKDKEGKIYHKISLNFKYNLYENGQSNQKYFESIIGKMSEKFYRSYQLIDEKKGIDIWYDYSKKVYTINGVNNFFNNNLYIEVENHTSIPSVKTKIESEQINKIIWNNWNIVGLNLEDKKISQKNNYINYDNFKIKFSNTIIDYIIFNSEYEDFLVKNIKVGDSFEKIKKELGNPIFKKSNEMIGYKTTELYIFFYEDEAVIYPCKYYNNSKLEILLFDFYEGNYEKYATNMVLEILEEYEDFTSEKIDNNVKLYSYIRGIEVIIKENNELEITIYDNYDFSDKMKKYAKSGLINLAFDDDSINLFEQERNN